MKDPGLMDIEIFWQKLFPEGVRIRSWFLVPPDNPLFPGIDCGLGSVRDVELAQDVADVPFYCVLTHHQLLSNSGITHATRN